MALNLAPIFSRLCVSRHVSHNDDDDMTREPEMVKTYRDTWELGLHSLSNLSSDRFLLVIRVAKTELGAFSSR